MARKFISGTLANPLEFFPNEIRRSRAKNKGEKAYKKYLRNEASNYIKRPVVREYILKRDGYKCCMCGSTKNLEIDHIKSIYSGGENNVDNLQILCRHCNAGKKV